MKNFEKYKKTDALGKYILSADQTVSLVLRTHLIAEGILDEIIETQLPKGKSITKSGRFTFAHKLTLVSSFNIIDQDIIETVRALNSLRNKLSHNLHESVSEDEVVELVSHMPSEGKIKTLAFKDKGAQEFLRFSLGFTIGMLIPE